jgi:hypothetical protein
MPDAGQNTGYVGGLRQQGEPKLGCEKVDEG